MNKELVEMKKNILSKFEKGGNVVLSTAVKNNVTSRVVSVISFNDSLYFTSVERPGAMKNDQIKQNPNVALSMNTIQMTGKAYLLGSTSNKENEEVMMRYKEVLPQSYEMFVTKSECQLIKIEISTFKDWKIVEGNMVVTNVDFENNVILSK